MDIIKKDIDVDRIRIFYKASIQYQLNSYKVNTDWLVEKIKEIYTEIYSRHGKDARVWLFFYYDEYDKQEGNWICRSSWREEGYQIYWNSNYHATRMRRMNEEVSKDDMLKELVPILKDTRLLHLEIESFIFTQKLVDEIRKKLAINEKRSRGNFLRSINIPKSNIDIEIFVENCLQYICLIDCMISDSNLYTTDMSFRYYLNNKLKECSDKWRKISPLLLDI